MVMVINGYQSGRGVWSCLPTGGAIGLWQPHLAPHRDTQTQTDPKNPLSIIIITKPATTQKIKISLVISITTTNIQKNEQLQKKKLLNLHQMINQN